MQITFGGMWLNMIHLALHHELLAICDYCDSEGIVVVWRLDPDCETSSDKRYYLAFPRPILPRHISGIGKAIDSAVKARKEFLDFLERKNSEA